MLIICFLPLVLVHIFADLDGSLVGRTQTLIPEMSELNMTFSGLTAAWIDNKRPVSSVQRVEKAEDQTQELIIRVE